MLSDLLHDSAARTPDKTALTFPGQDISFGLLDEQSTRVAVRLRRLGFGEGSRIGILHENALSSVVFFWGILKAGAQVVDIPFRAAGEVIDRILRECEPEALVLSERQLRRLVDARIPLPRMLFTERQSSTAAGTHSLEEILSTEATQLSRPRTRESDVALIVYTSGTTGAPKGVMLSHRNLQSNIYAVNNVMGLTSSDSILVVVPLHFIHGRMQLLTHALIGGTMVFSAGFQFPQQIVNDLAHYRVTGISGVPYHFSILLDRTNLRTAKLPDLRYVVVTGGALSPHALRRLSDALPGVSLHIGYGQTETSPRISTLSGSEVLSRPGSCGKPVPGVRVDIVDDNGSALPPGSTGEVVVSGPNVMCGYVSGDEVSSCKIDSFGRLHTGDLGRFDNEGYLYLSGRKSELIKCAGERVFPREIEEVLDSHPDVLESAAFGIPDETLGEKIVACVVVKADAPIDCEQIRTHCLKFLPLVRVPREVRFSSALPKTASGKIDRQSLPAHFNQTDIRELQQAA